jgi:hypothetical protein
MMAGIIHDLSFSVEEESETEAEEDSFKPR